ncbi:MAG: polysaccharide biosynthesis tyrosine autokinase [Phycisphaerae bacterium]|nr:polysaccharide biosynthesis tyrosine autokinase [Phycisphaerae bacterium]
MTTLTAATPAFGSTYLPGPFQRPSQQQAAASLTAADFMRAIRQRLVMILLLWFLLIGGTVAGTLYVQAKYPKFEANALIRVESLTPPDPKDPLRREATASKADIERELQNQTFLIRSPDVLTAAIQAPDMKRLKWFAEAEVVAKEKGEKLQDLLGDILNVGPLPDTNYLSVSASWREKTEVATIVNVVVNQYVSIVNRRQREMVSDAKDQLSQELDRAQRALKSKNDEIATFRTTANYSESAQAESQETLLTLNAMVTELEVEMEGRKAQWESLQTYRPEDLPITGELQAYLDSDPTLFQLQMQFQGAQQQLEQAMRRFGPNHRVVKDATMSRDAAYQNFSRDRSAKIIQFQSRQQELAQRNYIEANAQLLGLKDRLFKAKSEQQDREAKLTQYNALLDDREVIKINYESLLDRKNQLEMIIRQARTVQIEVAYNATEPMRMSSPKLAVWIPAGTFLGLMVSVGLALLLELADKSVRTPRDVTRAHLAVLGTIPTTDDDEVEIDRVETASLDAPHSVVAEAFRNLRANLFFSAPAEQQGVILVTSPSGGNGKTAVACNLAISIALSGRRVLLVDSNFRRAALPRVFPNVRAEGLSNILIGQGDLKDYATSTNVPGLDILSAGPLPPNPAELLGSSYLRDVVVDARSRYDQVIFDGPPVLLVSDAMVLAGAVDGVLLVCEYRNTSRGALQRTQVNLEAINARIFGAVLNKVQSRAGGYFRKQYREFYEYHETDEEANVPRPQLDVAAAAAAGAVSRLDSHGPGPKGSGGAADRDSAGGVTFLPSDRFEADSRGGVPDVAAETAAENIDALSRAASAAVVSNEETVVDEIGEDALVEVEDEALDAVEAGPVEPPMAATIEETDASIEDAIAGAFRDVGEPPAAGSGLIPDMSDVEGVDEFRLSEDELRRVEESFQRPEMPPTIAAPATPDVAGGSEADAPTTVGDLDEFSDVSDDDILARLNDESAIDLASSDSAVEPAGEMEAPADEEHARPSTSMSDPSASPFDLLEDEIDLGDDLTDLDSDEFRIDDKFDLDDDFDDPSDQGPRR